MALDTSFYGNIRPVEVASPLDSISKAMTLKQLGLQNQTLEKNLTAKDYDAEGKKLDHQVSQIGLLTQLVSHAKDPTSYAQAKEYAKTKLGWDTSMLPDEFPGQEQLMALTGLSSKQPERIAAQKQENEAPNQKLQAPKTLSEIAKNYADTDKTRSETIKRTPVVLGQTDDPAKLIPLMVPKEHQAKAFAEIDAAENTHHMGKSIMDSFDQAANDNTIMRTGFGMVRTPPSVLALHQSMQPTFKDMEGTVRQAAMDNTFRNITPAPGDSEETIATKRKALQDYLQSKASAPTARGYGVDLASYDRTAPYSKPDPRQQGDGENTANAADKQKLTSEDVSVAHRVSLALKKNPNDPGALQAKSILLGKGYKF